ncbi:MAG: tetratricopeptide repeat protein [Deltaproteobacteria bacterium]|nr:tetratricopeptide repeat protein [Deltaproteobacteria bacterium]
MSLGRSEGYARLVFNFRDRLEDVLLRRDDAGQLQADFGPAGKNEGVAAPRDDIVREVDIFQDGPRLLANISLSTNHFEVRHFLSRDGFSLVVDIRPQQDAGQPPPGGGTIPAPSRWRDELTQDPPSLQDVIRGVSSFVDGQPQPGTPERMVADALTLASGGDLDKAAELLEEFKASHPGHFYSDPVLFLLGDLYYSKGLPDNYQAAVDSWRYALDTFPQSFEAPRAAFMLGEAARDMGFDNEAAGYYRFAASTYPDSPWAPLATLRAADMSLAMNLNDEARKTVTPMTEKVPPDAWSLLAQLRLAMADYQDTLYSQAVERFRDLLDDDPEIYSLYPDMLYAMGDSYSYLDRPDLTVMFLEHAVNLEPDHPKADVMLARIGNALQALGRNGEAIGFFKIAKDTFPDRDGGLVSQIRLADMGALSTFFRGDQVFDALERGSRQATVKMYGQIISAASPSPLLQLAYLKIGQAQAADGENSDAIRWLRELVSNYPKGVLVDEAKPILSRAVVNEAAQRFSLGDYTKIEELSLDNSSFLEGPDRLRFMRLLAQSLERMGRHSEALDVWLAIEKDSPERRLADQKEIITTALAAGKPDEAFDQIKKTAAEFPGENDWLYARLYETAMAFATPRDEAAVADLLGFLDDPVVKPLPEISQLALSEAAAIEVENGDFDGASSLMDRYRRDYPDDELTPEYLLTQAKMDRRQNRTERYWDRLSEFRMRYPDDSRAPLTLVETISDARKRDRPEDAWRYEELYRQIYPRDFQGRKMLLDRAEEQWNTGQSDRAIDTLRLFQDEYPQDPQAPETYLNAYHKLYGSGRPGEAFGFLQAMRARYPDDPLTKESYLTEYRDAIRARFPDTAFAAFDGFRASYPDDPRVPDLLLEKAKDLMAFGRTRESLAAWDDFLENYPSDPRAPELVLLSARQDYREGDTGGALERYRRYLDGYPEHPERPLVLLEAAAIEGSLGINDQAYNDLETFRREFPGRPEEAQATLDEISHARALGRVPEAVALYDIFRESFPNHPRFSQSFLDETRMLLENGDPSAALAILEDGVVRSPGIDDTRDVQELLLSLYLGQNRIEDWAGAQEEFLRRDPDPQARLAERFERYSQVGQVYQELGRATDAQRNLDLAMANKPPEASGEALYTIAGGYKRMGLTDSYRQVLQVMSELPDPLWQRVAEQELAQG